MQKNTSIIAIVGILAVILIGGGIFALNSSSDETSSTQVTQTATPTPTAMAAAKNIVGLAQETPALSTLVAAVTAADLGATLSGTGPFTVFAPTNDAFAALPAGTLDSLLLPENKQQLQKVLTYHVVPSKVMSIDLRNGQEVTTVQGQKLTVNISNGVVTITDSTGKAAKVITADVSASNGVVHVIDAVVLPE